MTDDTDAVSPALRAVKDITFGSVRPRLGGKEEEKL